MTMDWLHDFIVNNAQTHSKYQKLKTVVQEARSVHTDKQGRRISTVQTVLKFALDKKQAKKLRNHLGRLAGKKWFTLDRFKKKPTAKGAPKANIFLKFTLTGPELAMRDRNLRAAHIALSIQQKASALGWKRVMESQLRQDASEEPRQALAKMPRSVE